MNNFIGQSYINKSLCDKLINYFESSNKKFKGSFFMGSDLTPTYDPKKKETMEIVVAELHIKDI